MSCFSSYPQQCFSVLISFFGSICLVNCHYNGFDFGNVFARKSCHENIAGGVLCLESKSWNMFCTCKTASHIHISLVADAFCHAENELKVCCIENLYVGLRILELLCILFLLKNRLIIAPVFQFVH